MSFVMLWIENLAVSLLLMAWLTACVGRWQSRWRRGLAWTAAALVVLLLYAYLAVYAGILQFSGVPRFHWFYYALALAVAVMVGLVVLRAIGLKRSPEGISPTVAGQWPRGKLAAAWAVALVLHVLTIENLDEAARRQLDSIRSESIAQIRVESPASVPDRENAAPLYAVAADVYSDFGGSSADQEKQTKWLEGVLNAFDAKDAALTRFMRQNEPVVRVLREAADRPACVVEPDYRVPFAIAGRSYSHLHNTADDLAMLLATHSRWKLAAGDRDAAFRDVDVLCRFAGHMTRAGLLGPARAVGNRWFESLQYLLATTQPTASELQRINVDEFWSCRRSELQHWPMLDSQLRWCVQGWGSERDWARNFMMFEYQAPTFGRLSNSRWYRIFLLQKDLELVDRLSSDIESQLAQPYWLAMKHAAENPGLREDILKRRGPGGVMLATFAAQFLGDLPWYCANFDARHSAAVTALAVARFQAKYGRPPKDLDSLVPEFLSLVPRDPFDGKPIKYETTDSSIVIYSVGQNLMEGGGVSEATADKARRKCFTFELPRYDSPPKGNGKRQK